ncbi:RagB/SusD family nutrient uptake outer membrane protein [uncultured Algibacter sp.]|uniref:RagB/SusD family nutrient uptake outer membrane protein n=1 Tax=uncultured Algibacter sp. TaxID=298659 RepID=UPI0026309FE2|nr:RagB/SusD family nutrient uptake outer membrane protein [uncultured Algibacter sp.]
MKNIIKTFLFFAIAVSVFSCDKELDIPLSTLSESELVPDVDLAEKFTVAAYGALEMRREAAASNWTFGGTGSDNAYKGSTPGDQSEITQMEVYEVSPNNEYVRLRWRGLYEGVARANAAINVVNRGLESGAIDAELGNTYLGELRFLRGFFHFQAKMTFGNVPYVDENTTENPGNENDIWPNIEADFQFAIDNLDPDPVRYAGANQWNSKAYLAKVHMYQMDYPAAKPILQDIIDNGPYNLTPSFHQNFNYAYNNNGETVFAVQYAVNDGSGASQDNGNQGDELNYPHSASPFGCCGFYQPSHDLVNAYLTDSNGLPLTTPISDPADYVANTDPSDIVSGSPRNVPVEDGDAGTSIFPEETRTLDPRLDWTVARTGIPLFDRGDFMLSWARDPANGGPYYSKKLLWSEADDGLARVAGGWGQNIGTIQTNLIRYAEILLWRAEIAASESDLMTAMNLVDEVRARNMDSANWVKENDGVTDAANYAIGLYEDTYPGGFPDATFAMNAVVMEYRLETALEGHRFFDLVRRGIAEQVLNGYLSRPQFRGYLSSASFTVKRSIYPLPQEAINLAFGALNQNDFSQN